MPSKYEAKQPRGSKFKNTSVEERAREAHKRGVEISEAKRRMAMARLRRVLRHANQAQCVEILACYFNDLDLEAVVCDLEEIGRKANGVAT